MKEPRETVIKMAPKGQQKLSGKGIGSGRSSGKQLRTEEAIRYAENLSGSITEAQMTGFPVVCAFVVR